MTHDERARAALTDAINEHFNAVDYDGTHPIVEDILTALTAAGLRVVPSEPSEADVERVARALCEEADFDADTDWSLPGFQRSARAAIRAFLAGGGDE
jgi:hypothetical protein